MRKIVISLHTSLDGYVAGPNGEMDWIKIDDEMFDMVGKLTDEADTALYGRVTWEMMDEYWPNAANKPKASKHDIEHSAWYNRVNKIVLSNTMAGTQKDKTTFIAGDIKEKITALKNAPGKNILIFGSPRASHTLMELNLIDEYWVFVNPIILGKGIPVFPPLNERLPLVPGITKRFNYGVTALNYTLK
jgi:dihydrofolate reductase